MIRTALAAALAVVLVAAAGAAWGSTSRVTSQPNGDVGLLVSVGCGGTDRDRDGDFNTCTNGDTAGMLYSVANRTDAAQTIRVSGVLDGSGSELDRTFTQELLIPANDLVNVSDEMRVKRQTPLGEYTLSVTAQGTETASTSAAFTVHSK
jgi:hypothetical protein